MSPPRKPRSPGRRQFSAGTPRDWEKVMRSKDVQRMMRDPQLSSALYQNFRATGGQVPQAPMRMQDGGGLPTPEDVNRIAQMRGGDVDPASANELQQLAVQTRPARFQMGGASMADLDAQEQRAQAAVQKATAANDPAAIKAAQDTLDLIRQRRAQMQMSPPGAASLGSFGNISGSTMQGLNKMTNPVSAGNEAAAILGGALMGGASGGGSGAGALIGAATAGLLNYFIRKHAQQQKQLTTKSDQSSSSDSSYSPSTYTPPPYTPPATSDASTSQSASQSAASAPSTQQSPAATPAGPGLWMGTTSEGANAVSNDGKNWIDSRTKQPVPASAVGTPTLVGAFGGQQTQPAAQPATTPATQPATSSATPAPTTPATPSGAGLWMGTTSSGVNAVSYDGQNWVNQRTNKPVSANEVGTPTLVGTFGSQPATQATLAPTQPASGLGAAANLNTQGLLDEEALASGDDDEDLEGLRRGGPVMGGRPHGLGMAIPVLHTTIVIAAKPKKKEKADKKSMGGDIPQDQRRPRKPNAIPPVRGPQNEAFVERPRPHGRVQVPRGSGAAIKGKRFGGIY